MRWCMIEIFAYGLEGKLKKYSVIMIEIECGERLLSCIELCARGVVH